jgi:hypothetical protein
MKILITMLLTFFVAGAAYAYTPPDSCLKMRCPDDYDVLTNTGTPNPDSVKVDSCFDSPTYGKRFAKKYFEAKFTQYPFDTLIGITELKRVYDLRDDMPGLKQQFQELEQDIGTIYFKRIPKDDVPDPNWLYLNGWVTIFFENYQNIEGILKIMVSEIDSIKFFDYLPRDGCEIMEINDDIKNQKISLFPNPVKEKLNLFFEKKVNEKILIYSFNGQSFEFNYQEILDVSELTNGIYYLIYNESIYKFIKIK